MFHLPTRSPAHIPASSPPVPALTAKEAIKHEYSPSRAFLWQKLEKMMMIRE